MIMILLSISAGVSAQSKAGVSLKEMNTFTFDDVMIYEVDEPVI